MAGRRIAVIPPRFLRYMGIWVWGGALQGARSEAWKCRRRADARRGELGLRGRGRDMARAIMVRNGITKEAVL